jgi:hypothetical protein
MQLYTFCDRTGCVGAALSLALLASPLISKVHSPDLPRTRKLLVRFLH